MYFWIYNLNKIVLKFFQKYIFDCFLKVAEGKPL